MVHENLVRNSTKLSSDLYLRHVRREPHKRDIHTEASVANFSLHQLQNVSVAQVSVNQTSPPDHDMTKFSSSIRLLFEKYGKHGFMTFEGFQKLMKNIGLAEVEVKDRITGNSENSQVSKKHPSNENDATSRPGHAESHLNEAHDDMNASDFLKCPESSQILHSFGNESRQSLTVAEFIETCPLLLYLLDAHICDAHDSHCHCSDHDDDHHIHIYGSSNKNGNASADGWSMPSPAVWGYSFLSCVVISAIGLLAVGIIPIMNQVFYNHLLQFLVALAIGSLSGDALLHLLPHAVVPHVHRDRGKHHSNETNFELEHSTHDILSEKRAVWCGLTALSGIFLFFIVERLVGFCSEKRRIKHGSQESDSSKTTGLLTSKEEKKKSTKLSHNSLMSCEEIVMMVHSNKDVRKMANDAHDEVHRNCEAVTAVSNSDRSHISVTGGHHHSHEVPKSVAAVAWVVIFGDGLHNFADGLAIGSAFANSLTGGLSTSIAVICHELPHELGDFAMLLKAGMSAKKALVYNCVSSLLCVFGMVIGVGLGNIGFINSWIFSIIAGMFLYIALVDMLPEMKSVNPRKGENPLVHLGLQIIGMLMGSSIMLLIAIFEEKIHLE